MLSIIDDIIYMVRGDDEELPAYVHRGKSEVSLQPTEVLTLTVREIPTAESPVIFAATSEPGSNIIQIRHEHTANAACGAYSADIELITADGLHKTLWPVVDEDNIPSIKPKNRKNFAILPEVTMH